MPCIHSCQIDQLSNRQILEKKIVKGVHENRQKKKNRHIKWVDKLKVKKENYGETFD